MRWILRPRALPLALVLALGVMVTAELAGASHVRPKAATPLRVPLVPAYKQCTSPDRTHGQPLAFRSCNPPVQASNFLTVGTPSANGAQANSQGFLLLKVRDTSADQLLISMNIFDVRCLPATDTAVCNSANAADGPDYSGQLQGNMMIRVSDHYNGPNLNEAATMQDIPFPVNAPCVNTADTSIGAYCSTSFNPQPGIPPQDYGGRRTVIQLTQVQVFDGGPDGVVGSNDNTLFQVQGIFTP
jgi:hypothetical protein